MRVSSVACGEAACRCCYSICWLCDELEAHWLCGVIQASRQWRRQQSTCTGWYCLNPTNSIITIVVVFLFSCSFVPSACCLLHLVLLCLLLRQVWLRILLLQL